jgi:short subunit dehydrogenase-like uncharacterized protein
VTNKRGPIALYGATGYTGRLVAAELAAAGADFVLSGRSKPKLEALAEELGRTASVHPATLDDHSELRSLLEGCSVVIDCAGPFTEFGEPVLRAAIETGTHYLDTTGEQAYMNKVFRHFGADAERKRVALIPAMGFDYVPGDMLAALTAQGMGPLKTVSLAYCWKDFVPTRGTMLSAMHILKGGDVEYRRGAWRPAPQSFGRGRFDFGEDFGSQRMMRYPAGEQITVPRHVQTDNVRTTINAAGFSGGDRAGALLSALGKPLSLAMRTPLRQAFAAAVNRLPEGPSEESRKAARFKIVCDASSPNSQRRGTMTGSDVYGLTAASIARGAVIAASRGFRGLGALAPAQAFDPSGFLAGLERFDVSWNLEPAGKPQPEHAEATA